MRLSGSTTTPAYRARIAAAFAKVPGAQGYTPPAAASSTPLPDASTAALPPDATYEQQIGAFVKRRDDQLAALRDQRTGGLLDYGYQAQQDAQGNTTGLTFDPSNPNSRAALLLKHYQQAKTGTENGMAARGQLYSGARVNAQNANDSGYQTADDQQRKALLAFLSRNTAAGRDAANQYESDASTAYAGRVDRAPGSPLYNPATGTDQPTATAAAAVPAGVPLTAKQADPANWVVGTFTKNGRKYKRMGDGRVVPA